MIDPELIPLGVSDPDGHIGAVSQSHVDIDLISLDTGELLRRLSAIGSPLMIDGQRLIGWQNQPEAHRLRLFRLTLPPSDAAIEWSPVFDLPTWVNPQPNPDVDFAIKFGRDHDAYVLFWRARRRYRGGTAPPPGLQAEIDRQNAFERIDFSVQSLAIRLRSKEDGFEDERIRIRRGEDLARQAGAGVYRQAGQLYNAPWMTPGGERFLHSLGPVEADQQRLSIMRSNGSKGYPIISIDAQSLHQAAPELSLDGRHLAVVEREGAETFWRIYCTLNGERIASLSYRGALGSFRLFDRRLLYLEQNSSNPNNLTITVSRLLHAVDTHSGALLWSYDLNPMTISNTMFLPP